jgi:hypothetical protein
MQPPTRLDQNIGRDLQFLIQLANHIQGQWPISSHDLINPGPLSDDSDEGPKSFPGLLQPEFDGVDGVG